jgi:hypothetical protein
MKQIIFFLFIFLGGTTVCAAQTPDTAKPVKDNKVYHYFIINAGDKINAYYSDKPLDLETIEEFTTYVQTNAKILKDAKVVVTGKPKTGTFDEVLKVLSRYRVKNVTKNISPN